MFKDPSWDVVHLVSLVGVDFLQGPLHLCCGHTEGQLIWWWGEPDAKRGIGILETSIKGVEGVRKRQIPKGHSASLVL